MHYSGARATAPRFISWRVMPQRHQPLIGMRLLLISTLFAAALMAQDMPFPVPPQPAKKARAAADGNTARPHWVEASVLALSIAEQTERPLLLYFPADDADDLYGDEFKQLSTTRALFIRYNKSNTVASSHGIVPHCKPLALNPRAAYGIDQETETALLCDWHGNEYFRIVAGGVRPSQLHKLLDRLPEAVRNMRARLAKSLVKYDTSETRRDRVVALLKAMREDAWGLPEANEVVRAYRVILRAGAIELDSAVKAADLPALESLRYDFKGTDLLPAIEAAIDKLKARDG